MTFKKYQRDLRTNNEDLARLKIDDGRLDESNVKKQGLPNN